LKKDLTCNLGGHTIDFLTKRKNQMLMMRKITTQKKKDDIHKENTKMYWRLKAIQNKPSQISSL